MESGVDILRGNLAGATMEDIFRKRSARLSSEIQDKQQGIERFNQLIDQTYIDVDPEFYSGYEKLQEGVVNDLTNEFRKTGGTGELSPTQFANYKKGVNKLKGYAGTVANYKTAQSNAYRAFFEAQDSGEYNGKKSLENLQKITAGISGSGGDVTVLGDATSALSAGNWLVKKPRSVSDWLKDGISMIKKEIDKGEDGDKTITNETWSPSKLIEIYKDDPDFKESIEYEWEDVKNKDDFGNDPMTWALQKAEKLDVKNEMSTYNKAYTQSAIDRRAKARANAKGDKITTILPNKDNTAYNLAGLDINGEKLNMEIVDENGESEAKSFYPLSVTIGADGQPETIRIVTVEKESTLMDNLIATGFLSGGGGDMDPAELAKMFADKGGELMEVPYGDNKNIFNGYSFEPVGGDELDFLNGGN